MTKECTHSSDSPTTADRLAAELSFNRDRKDHEPVTDSSLTYGDLRLLAKQSSMIGEAARAVEEYSCRTAVPHIATEMSTLAERLRQAAFRPDEAAEQGEARATSEQVHRWIALAYREPEDHSRIDAPRFTRWNMEVAYRAGEMNAALTATPCPEASDAPDIVPVAWMRVLPGHVVGHIETQEDIALHQLAHGNFAPGTELKPLYSHDALAALRAELAAVQDIADALSGERDEWRDGCRAAEALSCLAGEWWRPKVRPLVWATATFGWYSGNFHIEDNGDNWKDDRYWLYYSEKRTQSRVGKFASEQAAKDAAQTVHDADILSALDLPAPSVEEKLP